jgi:hypothetical protein
METPREKWPIRVYRLGEEPREDLSALTIGERIAMVWQVTVDAWEIAGRKIPDYPIEEAPIRVVPSGVRNERGKA